MNPPKLPNVRLGLSILCLAFGVLAAAASPAAAAVEGPGWQLWANPEPTNFAVGGVNAVQKVVPKQGEATFSLGFEGEQTPQIAVGAEPAAVRAALEALPAIGSGDVEVSKESSGYLVTFVAALGGMRVAELQPVGASVLQKTLGTSSGTIGVDIFNVGATETNPSEPITITDTLPPGVVAKQAGALDRFGGVRQDFGIAPTFVPHLWNCTGNGPGPMQGVAGATVVTCTNDPLNLPSFAGGGGLPKTGLPGPNFPHPQPRLGIAVETSGEASGLMNEVSIFGGGAPQALTRDPLTVSSQPAKGGLAAADSWFSNADGTTDSQAGSHPYLATFAYTQATALSAKDELYFPGIESSSEPSAGIGSELRNLGTEVPPGLVGNLSRMPRCGAHNVVAEHNPLYACPNGSIVGDIYLENTIVPLVARVFNLTPPPGAAAALGFSFEGLVVRIIFRVEAGGDYPIVAEVPNAPQRETYGAILNLFGTPAAESHRVWHGTEGGCSQERLESEFQQGEYCSKPPGLALEPFLTLPTSCAGPLQTSFRWLNGWEEPNATSEATVLTRDAEDNPLGISGCNRLPFSPTISARPTTNVTDAPSGLEFTLHLPDQGLEDPEAEVSEADMKDATVTLPKGFVVDPSSANGLAACTPAQFGLTSQPGQMPVTTTPDPANCPDAAKIGNVEIDSPLLGDRNAQEESIGDHPLRGAVYVAQPIENPFGSLLAIYLTVNDSQSGTVLKLAGEVKADPSTGQLTTTFANNPQLPFEDFHLNFFGGARAALRTPQTCGKYQINTDMTPWSSPEGADAHPSDSFQLTQSPGGGACPNSEAALPNSPHFEAGTIQPKAGAYSPFVLHLARADGTQEIGKLEAKLPEGLLAKLAGVSECSDAQIAQAESRSQIGEGRLEQEHPSCPASSEVGVVHVGAGAGPAPYYATGHAYLAGPYKGAPISLEIVTPAVAGPYDLGTVAVRTALNVDPLTAQVQAVSDPIPHILQGIPLDVRSISLELDRSQFTLNPTSCAKKSITGAAGSVLGSSSALSVPFQVGECKGLAFKPKLSIALKGSTKHAGHPALKAVLTYPKGGGYANIARAQVNLPHSEFIDQGNLNKACTKPVLLEGKCPASTVYGHAEAWTPLEEAPLQGPVYLVGGFGFKLPALVAELDGQIRVLLVGKVDSGKNKGIRNTFEAVPDAPVEKFVLEMKGGSKYSLLENSEPLCAKPQKALARFTAQNGIVDATKVPIQVQCPRHHKAKAKKRHKGHGRH